MEFISEKECNKYCENLKVIGAGAQGTVYKNKNDIIKIYHYAFEDTDNKEYKLTKNEILKFKEYTNKSYIFPKEEITYNDNVVGYIAKYVSGKPLYKIDPLKVNINNLINSLDQIKEDTDTLSKKNILTYDVVYNTIYTTNKLKVIDTDEFCYCEDTFEKIKKHNDYDLNLSIMYFLIDNCFEEFIIGNPLLKEMYKNREGDIKEFIILLKKYLSEYIGNEINYLYEANNAKNKGKHIPLYIRQRML